MTNALTRALDYRSVLRNNYITNSAMMVSQENGTSAGVVSGYYPVDMTNVTFSHGGAVTIAQIASTTPGGSPNRIRVTVTTADAAVASSDFMGINHAIEGLKAADLLFGSAGAKTTTLQFGVKAPAGTYCVIFKNSAVNRSYVAEYVITGGEANTDVMKSVTIPGDQSGTWLKDNGVGLYVLWGLMCGATYQQTAGSWVAANAQGSANQLNFMGTISNVFELFDVSLTQGYVAPPFMVPDYASELLVCARYFYRLTSSTAAASIASGMCYSSTLSLFTFQFLVPMRAVPTCSGTGSGGLQVRVGAVGAIAASSVTAGAVGAQSARMDATVSSGLTAGQGVILEVASAGSGLTANARL